MVRQVEHNFFEEKLDNGKYMLTQVGIEVYGSDEDNKSPLIYKETERYNLHRITYSFNGFYFVEGELGDGEHLHIELKYRETDDDIHYPYADYVGDELPNVDYQTTLTEISQLPTLPDNVELKNAISIPDFSSKTFTLIGVYTLDDVKHYKSFYVFEVEYTDPDGYGHPKVPATFHVGFPPYAATMPFNEADIWLEIYSIEATSHLRTGITVDEDYIEHHKPITTIPTYRKTYKFKLTAKNNFISEKVEEFEYTFDNEIIAGQSFSIMNMPHTGQLASLWTAFRFNVSFSEVKFDYEFMEYYIEIYTTLTMEHVSVYSSIDNWTPGMDDTFKSEFSVTVNDNKTVKYEMTDRIKVIQEKGKQPHISAHFDVKPNCVCYVNTVDKKDVHFDFIIEKVKSNTIPTITLPNGQPLIMSFIKWTVEMVDTDTKEVLVTKDITEEPFLDYTFELEPNTVKKYDFICYATFGGRTFKNGKKTVIVERQQYCHYIEIEAKTYDLEGNETAQFPHPTSADWKEEQYSEITVKFKVKDEQGRLIDVPVDKIHTNWQYDVEKVDTGVYQMKIPNHKDSTALAIGDYGIAVYIDKDWCDENGYYNKHNIEAENIIINSDKIEKIGLWNFDGVDHYENGITYLNDTYETVSGVFVNPVCQFSIVEQLNEEKERRQYSYCYRIYDSSMTLTLPTYTDDEKKELAKAIVREMGKPRKIETFTILSKEIPKINNDITLKFNDKLISIPVYSVNFSLGNSNIQIQVKNDKLKLLKDYLQLIH